MASTSVLCVERDHDTTNGGCVVTVATYNFSFTYPDIWNLRIHLTFNETKYANSLRGIVTGIML